MKSLKPNILISACLLGEKVRHDGGHKLDRWLSDELSQFVNFIPICPEVAMGLGTPRATLRLVSDHDISYKKMVESESGKDVTELYHKTAEKILESLPEIHGAILTHKSPSCGVKTTKIYHEKSGMIIKKGNGLFADSLAHSHLMIPIIDSGLICDPLLKENFFRKVFCLFEFSKIKDKSADIQDFHQRFKYFLMEHDPKSVAKLGNIAANRDRLSHVKASYSEVLKETLLHKGPSYKKRLNVFYHLLGYFKNDLSSIEKKHITDKFEDYRNNRTSYLSILELFRFLVTSKSKEYLSNQVLLGPYPDQLKLLKLIDHG